MKFFLNFLFKNTEFESVSFISNLVVMNWRLSVYLHCIWCIIYHKIRTRFLSRSLFFLYNYSDSHIRCINDWELCGLCNKLSFSSRCLLHQKLGLLFIGSINVSCIIHSYTQFWFFMNWIRLLQKLNCLRKFICYTVPSTFIAHSGNNLFSE